MIANFNSGMPVDEVLKQAGINVLVNTGVNILGDMAIPGALEGGAKILGDTGVDKALGDATEDAFKAFCDGTEDVLKTSSDAFDSAADSLKIADDALDAGKAIPDVSDTAKVIDNGTDAAKVANNGSDVAKVLDNSSDIAKAIGNSSDVAKTIESSTDTAKATGNSSDVGKVSEDAADAEKAVTNVADAEKTADHTTDAEKAINHSIDANKASDYEKDVVKDTNDDLLDESIEQREIHLEHEQNMGGAQESKTCSSENDNLQGKNSNNKDDSLFKRGSFRKATKENAVANAPRDADGNMICPTCGEVIPEKITQNTKNGARTRVGYDLDHYPETWNERVKKMKTSGHAYTRKEVLDRYNEDIRVLCPPCNEGHKFEGIEGKYSNGK